MERVVPLVAVAHLEREDPHAPLGSKERHRNRSCFAVGAVDDRNVAGTKRHTDGIVGIATDERRIQEARAKESGQPAEIVAKMVEGSLNKFLGEITLMGQPFIKDDKQTIEKMLAAKKTRVSGYAFLVVGE